MTADILKIMMAISVMIMSFNTLIFKDKRDILQQELASLKSQAIEYNYAFYDKNASFSWKIPLEKLDKK